MIGKVLVNEKNHLEFEITNLTMAELLRNFLWEDSSVKFAAWKRDHPIHPAILVIKTEGKTAKKALEDCLARIDKLSEKTLAEFKKSVKK